MAILSRIMRYIIFKLVQLFGNNNQVISEPLYINYGTFLIMNQMLRHRQS